MNTVLYSIAGTLTMLVGRLRVNIPTTRSFLVTENTESEAMLAIRLSTEEYNIKMFTLIVIKM